VGVVHCGVRTDRFCVRRYGWYVRSAGNVQNVSEGMKCDEATFIWTVCEYRTTKSDI
jgi:hypothetical protein